MDGISESKRAPPPASASVAKYLSAIGGMTPKGELRLIVMLLSLKKAVPDDDSTGHFLQSFAAFHGFGMATVLSCGEKREEERMIKMVQRLSKMMYASYARGGKVEGHEQREVGHLTDMVQTRDISMYVVA